MSFGQPTVKFKQNLRRLREYKAYTKSELAAKLGWSDSKYSRIEDIGANGASITIDDADSLGEFFEIPTTFLFDARHAAMYGEAFLTNYEFIEGYVRGKWTLNEVRHQISELYSLMNDKAYQRYTLAVRYLTMIGFKNLIGYTRLNRVLEREEEFDLTSVKSKMLEPNIYSSDP
mgnify:CR=1 FL=1|tara:strand:+ start:931 stop:1452 length:522 start_codon:yes stop_codon:yes gene_type:complete